MKFYCSFHQNPIKGWTFTVCDVPGDWEKGGWREGPVQGITQPMFIAPTLVEALDTVVNFIEKNPWMGFNRIIFNLKDEQKQYNRLSDGRWKNAS